MSADTTKVRWIVTCNEPVIEWWYGSLARGFEAKPHPAAISDHGREAPRDAAHIP
jgi:hypothetical protein